MSKLPVETVTTTESRESEERLRVDRIESEACAPARETLSRKSSGKQCLTAASTTPSPNFTSTLGLPVRGFAVSKLPVETVTASESRGAKVPASTRRPQDAS